MASGHVSRINRPNTWLLRPDLRREESPCQHGAVHTWHKADHFRVAVVPSAIGGFADVTGITTIVGFREPPVTQCPLS